MQHCGLPGCHPKMNGLLLTLLRLIIVALLLAPLAIKAQSSIEITLLSRYDVHANYSSNYAGRAYDDTQRISGISYGINAGLRQPLARNLSGYVSIGYYRLSVDRIRGEMPFGAPGTRTARNIRYDDGVTNLLYSTQKYYYGNGAITAGVAYSNAGFGDLRYELGAEYVSYFGYAQRYDLGRATMYAPRYYRTRNSRGFEYGINVTAGLVVEQGSWYIRPAIILPVYQRLNGDEVFYETEDVRITNWFSGMGLMVRVGRELGRRRV